MTLRIVFAGSPAAAVPGLRALLDGPHGVVAVVTREDAPLGRKRVLTPTPVAEAAEAAGVPVIKANRLRAVEQQILDLEPDLGVVIAYGGLIRDPLLTAPRLGWINLHFSLLPAFRGAAPVQRALIAGEAETGVAVFRLVEELDAGPLYANVSTPIGARETAGHLLERLADEGAPVLAEVVGCLAEGAAEPLPQLGEPSFAPKLTLADGELELEEEAESVDARLRGVTPEPGAWVMLGGERFKIHEAAIAHEVSPIAPGRFESRGKRVLLGTLTAPLELITVQPPSKKAMAAGDWWRGRPAHAPDQVG